LHVFRRRQLAIVHREMIRRRRRRPHDIKQLPGERSRPAFNLRDLALIESNIHPFQVWFRRTLDGLKSDGHAGRCLAGEGQHRPRAFSHNHCFRCVTA